MTKGKITKKVTERIKKVAKKTTETAKKAAAPGGIITALGLYATVGEYVKKQLLKEKPRPIIDYCIDHLKDFNQINESGTDEKTAEENLKKRINTAGKKGKENRLVSALCKILELDRDKNNNYTSEFPLTRRRLAELGLMELKDFKQSIELLIDDPIQELIEHDITKPIDKQIKKIRKQIKKINPEKIANEIQKCNQVLEKQL